MRGAGTLCLRANIRKHCRRHASQVKPLGREKRNRESVEASDQSGTKTNASPLDGDYGYAENTKTNPGSKKNAGRR